MKEIKDAKISVKDIKLEASLNIGITALKEALVNGVMKVVNELSLQVANLMDEQKEEENKTAIVSQLLGSMKNHEQTMQNLWKISAGQPDRVNYCQEFAYHLRWLKHAKEECIKLTKARANLLIALAF